MIRIAKEEKSREEPHESSFWPKRPSTSRTVPDSQEYDQGNENTAQNTPNGQLGPHSDPSLDRTLVHSSTDNSAWRVLRTTDTEREGFLPCHYFDLIAGTSTGG